MHDLIGDIHGHYEPLCNLLKALGYQAVKDTYKHPEGRQVVFVGDYIDRGPEIFQVLRLVRSMVAYGHAIALMGNHEFNALAYHTQDANGNFCRPHTPKNQNQHKHTLEEIALAPTEWQSHLDWMLTLPLWLELDGFRAVHACWDEATIAELQNHLSGNRFQSFEQIVEASDPANPLYHLVEDTLKGKEMKLPHGLTFHDKDGHQRDEIRVKWWENPEQVTLKDYSVVDLPDLPEAPTASSFDWYKPDEPPVFFGHYWLRGMPELQKPNVCCLDYSIAKGGSLVAYRWHGEQPLSTSHFVEVKKSTLEDRMQSSAGLPKIVKRKDPKR